MALLHSASITLGLTLLLLASETLCTLTCKEDNNQLQSVKLSAKTKPPRSKQNSYELSLAQRSHAIYPPIVSRRWEPSRTITLPTYSSKVMPAESSPQQRIVIPVGVSHYRPVQYVDSFKHEPLPLSYFDKVLASVKANRSPSSSTTEASVNNTVAASSDISEVKVSGDASGTSQPAPTHPARFIELESSYVPLTIRFPSRATKLNIIPGDNDLVGQDSTRHDSFGRRAAVDSDNSRSVNLDSRVIFGEEKHEEPIVLKQGSKSQIPSNMQRIIKCIFPDFHFDGEDKVQSAC